jgi:hypothetical protein
LSIVSFLLVLTIFASFLSQVEAITWSVKRTQLTNYEFTDQYPAVMETRDRRLWVVWSREVDANMTLFYKISSDLGKTWSSEKNLTVEPTPGRADTPAIMQAKNGTIWVTWASTVQPPRPPTPDFDLAALPLNLKIRQGSSGNSTIIVTSKNGFTEEVKFITVDQPQGVSTSFNPPQVIPPPNNQTNSTLTVSANSTAIPGNYTFTVVGKGTSQTHSIHIDLEVTAGGTMQSPIQNRLLASSEVTPTQEVADYEIYFKTSHDNGVTWSRDISFTDNTINDLHPAITQLYNGTIMILWQNAISGNDDIWYKATTDGINWSNATQLTNHPSKDTAPAVAQMKDGKIWLTWCSDRNGNADIFYKVYNGASWSSDTLLIPASSIDSDVQPAIVQAIDGNILIFWVWDNYYDFDIYCTNSTNNGMTWSTKTPFVASSYEDEWPAAVRTQDTRIWVAWMSNEAVVPDSNFEIYLKGSLAGDVNSDGRIDVVDFAWVAIAYGTQQGDVYYNYAADINRDGIVDISDIWVVAYYIDET